MSTTLTDRIKISATFWLGLQTLGINAAALLRQARLPLAVYTGEGAVTTQQYFALWQALYDLTGDSAIGISLSTQLPTDKFPPSLLSAYHARDYLDALQRMARYTRLCIPEYLQLNKDEAGGFIELIGLSGAWRYSEQAEPAPLIDANMATLLELGRRGTGVPIKARLIELKHSKRDIRAHEAYFGCRVRLGAAHNRLYLHTADLARSFASYNAELLALLTPALDKQVADARPSHSFSETVSWLLARQLSAGRPDIPLIAQALGISQRTLQRRLTQEGTHFQQLLSEVRRARAHELLLDNRLDFTEVALLLGYEDQSSFFRAFRLWEDSTPSDWRARQQ